ncbi:hypothetical protein V8G54_006682 [Vigna mungo]|uniref:Uncharacterized protein n=1 Tax=Vigna mungo TaxID=3915 RepID=A0AAQ3P1W7_VIGMU
MCDPNFQCSKDDDSSNDDVSDEEDKDTDHEDYCRSYHSPRRRYDLSSGPWIDLHKPKEQDPLWFQKRCAEIRGKEGRFSFPQETPQPQIPCFMISNSNYKQENFPLWKEQLILPPGLAPSQISLPRK